MNTFPGFSEEDLVKLKLQERQAHNHKCYNVEKPIPDSKVKYLKIEMMGKQNNNYRQNNLPIDNNVPFRSVGLQLDLSDEYLGLQHNRKTDHPQPLITVSSCEIAPYPSDNVNYVGDVTHLNMDPSDRRKSDPSKNQFNEEEICCPPNDTSETEPEISDITEAELAKHRTKVAELQMKQKLMEEQNKKRTVMIAKALADRTRQSEEEKVKLEKIKKELAVLEGQFSQDVSMLRRRIDQASMNFANAEKQFLRAEKEYITAKLQLKKDKEKKELLTEHLCALITHNETKKSQKLELLMLDLATSKANPKSKFPDAAVCSSFSDSDDDYAVIIDGVHPAMPSKIKQLK